MVTTWIEPYIQKAWHVGLSSIKVSGDVVPGSLNTVVNLDTGTTLIYGEANSVAAIYGLIPGSIYNSTSAKYAGKSQCHNVFL